jgi:hypothetical protein
MSIDRLVNTRLAIDMSASSNITILNLIEAYVAQELFLKCSHTDLEVPAL